MLKDKLDVYLKRKELSKKAVNEIISILVEFDYSSDESIEELVEMLYALSPDVIYNFVCDHFEKVPYEKIGVFVDMCEKSINSYKFTHAFCLIISLSKQSKKMEAETIINFVVKNYLLAKKINNRIFASFEKALHYDGGEFLLEKLLESVNVQALQLFEDKSLIELENKRLNERGAFLSENIKSCELSKKDAENKMLLLRDELGSRDNIIAKLRQELAISTDKIDSQAKEIEELSSKLSNVESAYGNAGQQEIEYLKGQIRKRLNSEYSKYMEVKKKAPDLDYYNILLDMLDEIYYVLAKNGIKFN